MLMVVVFSTFFTCCHTHTHTNTPDTTTDDTQTVGVRDRDTRARGRVENAKEAEKAARIEKITLFSILWYYLSKREGESVHERVGEGGDSAAGANIFVFIFFLFDLVQDSCNFFNTIFKTKLEPGRSKVLSRYRARETNWLQISPVILTKGKRNQKKLGVACAWKQEHFLFFWNCAPARGKV